MVKTSGASHRDPHPLKFFAVLGLQPLYVVIALAAVFSVGLFTVWLNAAELDSGLGMILFAQMFLASTGFTVPARRGHFDPLLVGPGNRTSAVVWHWVASVAPGIASWVCLAGAGYVLGSPVAASAFVGERAAALFIVSALAWAAGFGLPRGAAGVGWIAALIGVLVRHADLLSPVSALSGRGGNVLAHAATLAFCPFLLIGTHPPVAAGATWAAALSSAIVLLAVWRRSSGLDVYLADPS